MPVRVIILLPVDRCSRKDDAFAIDRQSIERSSLRDRHSITIEIELCVRSVFRYIFMPSIDSDYEDEDNRCSSQRRNSDDDGYQFTHHTHRLCSRNGPCTEDKHQHRPIEPTDSPCRSKRSRFTRGDIRPADNEPGHRVKYDGTRWRRICSVPTCACYLIGGVYFANWLCRQHYLLAAEHEASEDSDSSAIMSRTGNALTRKRLSQPSARKSCYKVLK